MTSLSEYKYDNATVRRWLRHLIMATRRYREKQSKGELNVHLDKIKALSKDHKHKPLVHKEVEELRSKINSFQGKASKPDQAMREKMEMLDRKLNLFMQMLHQREQRIQDIETKIKKKMKSNEENVEIVAAQISKLEKSYRAMKKTGKHSKSKLKEIRTRITQLKNRIKS